MPDQIYKQNFWSFMIISDINTLLQLTERSFNGKTK